MIGVSVNPEKLGSTMETVNVDQIEINLPELLYSIKPGEEVIVADQGIPIAKLVPLQRQKSVDRCSSLGVDRGLFVVPDDFNDPLPNDIWPLS
ncbi:ssl1004 [Synechocystis sp. PCC 6803]|uniref:Ssl1004 protein n=2 Tax=Synechocystis TaxID=1142 RepID=Q55520_SYNY3|nr:MULTISPECIES: type II toxin-antitoxin system Phd/YefM family antitoxin [unclassified Synechocystis]MBD2618028.1 type II toxin-antitoxin system Phd/YefM family antitoxin [Synechocystis sp. FACHB-898]BAM53520.1 hypothetical protein BEST7613_4589 [Synechocystis sp. PCC 6803] [Bacillus subtilis BEST7613]AGF53170.1 hypothetical protein MYO_129440 [Synechocystis sp. PCC 6803]AVP90911.1 type II toxin-antitoxin system Phd/YefM family antitoxin [Synechocystis sp. IPPAS B-1465]MBD2639251.1 type II to